MITEIKSHNSQINYGKTWCDTCPKTLAIEEADDYGMEALDQSAIDFLLGVAAHHERKHPKHNITVTVYERVPTIQELKSGRVE